MLRGQQPRSGANPVGALVDLPIEPVQALYRPKLYVVQRWAPKSSLMESLKLLVVLPMS